MVNYHDESPWLNYNLKPKDVTHDKTPWYDTSWWFNQGEAPRWNDMVTLKLQVLKVGQHRSLLNHHPWKYDSNYLPFIEAGPIKKKQHRGATSKEGEALKR